MNFHIYILVHEVSLKFGSRSDKRWDLRTLGSIKWNNGATWFVLSYIPAAVHAANTASNATDATTDGAASAAVVGSIASHSAADEQFILPPRMAYSEKPTCVALSATGLTILKARYRIKTEIDPALLRTNRHSDSDTGKDVTDVLQSRVRITMILTCGYPSKTRLRIWPS